MSTQKLSLSAQAETVRILVDRILPGTKAVTAREAELLAERGRKVIATLELFDKHEDALREMMRVRAHIEDQGAGVNEH